MLVVSAVVSARYSAQFPWLPGDAVPYCLRVLVVANLFFLVGPGVEAFLSLYGLRSRWLRVALFLFVTVSAMWFAWFLIVLSGPLADSD